MLQGDGLRGKSTGMFINLCSRYALPSGSLVASGPIPVNL
jgi:hypothetical protein